MSSAKRTGTDGPLNNVLRAGLGEALVGEGRQSEAVDGEVGEGSLLPELRVYELVPARLTGCLSGGSAVVVELLPYL